MYNTAHIRPVLGIVLSATLDQLFEFGFFDAVVVEPAVIFDGVHDHDFVHVLERDAAARYFPGQGADCVHVRTLRVVLLLDQFGRHLVHGAALVEAVAVVDFVAQPEVTQLNFTSFTDQHIVAFDVLVHLPIQMHEFDSYCYFEEYVFERLAFLLGFVGVYAFVQTHIHELEQQYQFRRCPLNADDVDNIRVP